MDWERNLGVTPEPIWKLGGGSSKEGSVGAAGRREFKGCGGEVSASSAVPIPACGTARAARLATEG